jgi:hypothetical protein
LQASIKAIHLRLHKLGTHDGILVLLGQRIYVLALELGERSMYSTHIVADSRHILVLQIAASMHYAHISGRN